MYLHEHDAKELLTRYGVPVPAGICVGIGGLLLARPCGVRAFGGREGEGGRRGFIF